MADAKLRSQADKAHELVKQKLTTEALPLLVDVVRAEGMDWYTFCDVRLSLWILMNFCVAFFLISP
jgi:hypothetical protein